MPDYLWRVNDLNELPTPRPGGRLVIGCAPDDVETWQLSADALGLNILAVPRPGLREGLAFAWHAGIPSKPKQHKEAA